MKWPILGGFWGPNFPKYGQILLKFLPEVVLKDTKSVFEESLKNPNFHRNGRYTKFARFLQLWGQFTPWRWPKSKKIKTFTTKIQPSGYPNPSTPTPYLFSPSNEKQDYFLHFLSIFWWKKGRGHTLRARNQNLTKPRLEPQFLAFRICKGFGPTICRSWAFWCQRSFF